MINHLKKKPQTYKNFPFKFKITDSHIIFGDEVNPYRNLKMEINEKYFNKELGLDGNDVLLAHDMWSHLIYKNGILSYTQSTEGSEIFVATASCTKF